MPVVRSHNRGRVLAETADGKVQDRRPTVINPGFVKEEEQKARLQEQKNLKNASADLAQDIEIPDAGEARGWDRRFLPERMRVMEGLVDDPTTDNSGSVGASGGGDSFWGQQRFMPERLRQLVEQGPVATGERTQEWRIVTRAEIEGEEQPLVFDRGPTEDTDATVVDGGGSPPVPPDDTGGGSGGGSGDGEGVYQSTVKPPPSRFDRIISSAALAIGGAIAGYSALQGVNMVTDQATMSNAAMVAMAAGAAAPLVVVKARQVFRGARAALSKKTFGLSPEWGEFAEQSGWRRRQCRRWAAAGFAPQEAAEWEHEFSRRKGQRQGGYPAGGNSGTVKAAKEFRDFFPGRQISPEQARPYIEAWVTPGDLKAWTSRYWNPAYNFDRAADPQQNAVREKAREAFLGFLLSAHKNACEQYGYSHKDIDVAMRNECKRRDMAPLQRYDRPATQQRQREQRPYTVQDAAFDGAALGDMAY